MDFYIFSKYFLQLIFYSCAGWLMETISVSIQNKKLAERGFLIGPVCPIYGCGALAIITVLGKFSFNPALLFIMTVIACGALEYFTSWMMEVIFKARWWDYSKRKFNINGRVCLMNLIAFGILGLLVTYVLNPFFEQWINSFTIAQVETYAILIGIIFIIDVVISFTVIYGFRNVAEKVNRERREDNTEQITKMVRDLFAQKSFLHRRILKAFPKLEAIKIKMKEIKSKIEEATNDAKDKMSEKTEGIKNNIEQKIRKERE